jgi:cation diffusion facilitator CzcD-associated flavoprotein CzcO
MIVGPSEIAGMPKQTREQVFGLSGIGVAYHRQRDCPRKSFVMPETRGAIGGTWDLFRYLGIRSESNMHTPGYRFRPWRSEKAIADGLIPPRVGGGFDRPQGAR